METQSVDTQIDELVRDNKIHRFAYELENTTDDSRKTSIMSILKLLQGTKEEEKDALAKSKRTKLYDDIDIFSLKRKWNKLSTIQKQNRLKDYCTTTINDQKIRSETEKKLFDMLENATLKPKFIVYDVNEGKITSITIEEKAPRKVKSKDVIPKSEEENVKPSKSRKH